MTVEIEEVGEMPAPPRLNMVDLQKQIEEALARVYSCAQTHKEAQQDEMNARRTGNEANTNLKNARDHLQRLYEALQGCLDNR